MTRSAPSRARATLEKKLKLGAEVFEKALEKLWMNGAAHVSPDEAVTRGEDGWQRAYDAQRRLRREQAELMGRYTTGDTCRMLLLVRHFGDRADDGAPCGLCDVCAPAKTLAMRFRAPDAREAELAADRRARLPEIRRAVRSSVRSTVRNAPPMVVS